jgi:peptidyl-prolyl cis-trans isomerase C
MKKHILSSLAAATLLVALSPAVFAQNVAIVNGKPIPKARLEALSKQMERAGRPVNPEVMNQLREEVILREIFMQEAQAQGLDTSEDYRTQVELARQSILIREMFTQYQKNNPVTDAEIKAEYDKFVAANSGKEFRARHILVEQEDKAKALIAQLKKGAKFEDLAKKESKDPGSGKKGGDLDWANPSSYVKEFADALSALSKGKMTDTPVKSQFGYHIIRLDDIREAQLPKLDDVKPQISQQLQQQKMAKFQEDLRAKAKIE